MAAAAESGHRIMPVFRGGSSGDVPGGFGPAEPAQVLATAAQLRAGTLRATSGAKRSVNLTVSKANGLKRDCRAHAAGSACAGLVQRAIGKVAYAVVRMSDMGPVRTRLGGVSAMSNAVMIVRHGVGAIVLVLPQA